MKLRAENIALNCGFCKKSLQVPFCEEKSVQLVRVAFFRSDILQNPYFRVFYVFDVKDIKDM